VVASTAYLDDALALFMGSDTDRLVVADRGQPVGLIARSTLEEALARRLAEGAPQPPNLLRPFPRIRRIDETHLGQLEDEEDLLEDEEEEERSA
jgi:hypothetical protein